MREQEVGARKESQKKLEIEVERQKKLEIEVEGKEGDKREARDRSGG